VRRHPSAPEEDTLEQLVRAEEAEGELHNFSEGFKGHETVSEGSESIHKGMDFESDDSGSRDMGSPMNHESSEADQTDNTDERTTPATSPFEYLMSPAYSVASHGVPEPYWAAGRHNGYLTGSENSDSDDGLVDALEDMHLQQAIGNMHNEVENKVEEETKMEE
jgi:hypothetical protein